MPVGVVNGGIGAAGARRVAEREAGRTEGGDLFLRKTDRRFHQALVPTTTVRGGIPAGINGRIDPMVVSFLDPHPQDRRGLSPHEHVRLLDQLQEAAGHIDPDGAAKEPLQTQLTEFFSREKEMFQSFQWSRMAVLPC